MKKEYYPPLLLTAKTIIRHVVCLSEVSVTELTEHNESNNIEEYNPW